LQYAEEQSESAFLNGDSGDQSQNHEDEYQNRRDNPRLGKHFFNLRQRSAEKTGGTHGDEIAQRVDNTECDKMSEEDADGTDDAHDDAE